MTTTLKTNILLINVSDRASESYLNKIEAAARGTIGAVSDDGCGRMTLRVRPRVRPLKADKKAILEAVKLMGLTCHWA